MHRVRRSWRFPSVSRVEGYRSPHDDAAACASAGRKVPLLRGETRHAGETMARTAVVLFLRSYAVRADWLRVRVPGRIAKRRRGKPKAGSETSFDPDVNCAKLYAES